MLEILGEDFRKVAGGRHDEAVVVIRPGYQVLDTSVLKHTVEFVDERSLNYFWALCSSNGAGPRNRGMAMISVPIRPVLLSFGTVLGRRPHTRWRRGAHSGVFVGGFW